MTDGQSPDEKSPVEQALDLLVFAPLGLAMTARTQLPDMVAKGRAQVEGQITVARFLGQFAVQHGKAEVEKRLKAFTAAPPEPYDAGHAGGDPVVAEPVAAPEAVVAPLAPEPAVLVPEPELAPGPPTAVPAAGDLAIPGYDALSASHVVQRLAGLSPAELEQVRAYEAASRGRKTVLTKISQLQ